MEHNKKTLKEIRKYLRNHGTPAEAYLWKYLQHSKLDGRKFRRQHSVGNYVVDFFCFQEMLAVELDGELHNQSIEEDVLRDNILKAEGIIVLRFENRFVFEHTDFVLEEIKNNFKSN